MSERDELADEILRTAIYEGREGIVTTAEDRDSYTYLHCQNAADAILAAGYRKPRTITTAEELDALPAGAIILDGDPDACMKTTGGRWRSISDPTDTFQTAAIAGSLPAVVVYNPEEPQP